jgi:hypothetical protein
MASSAAARSGKLDEGEAARAARLAIERTNDLGRLPELRKMGTQVFFGCLIRQVSDKESDWWHG